MEISLPAPLVVLKTLLQQLDHTHVVHCCKRFEFPFEIGLHFKVERFEVIVGVPAEIDAGFKFWWWGTFTVGGGWFAYFGHN